MNFNPIRDVIRNEGCDLHYWYQGNGPLLVFVPGGNGHGRQFNDIIAALSDRFTGVTFDRRQMSASQVKVNKRFNPPQQARDIRAIIRALGFDKAILFGSSGGGVLSFQFAHDFPDMVDRVISHEAGLTSLLPDASDMMEWGLHLLDVRDTQGIDQAAAMFEKHLIGYDDEDVPATVPPGPENQRNFWEYEFPIFLGYTPNLWRVKENKVAVGVMRGIRCRDAFYARSVTEQAKILDCPHAVVPGNHQGFETEMDEFIPSLLEMLDVLEKRKAEL